MHKHALTFALCFAALATMGSSHAVSSPIGIWIDHTGRGAVEITECGANLCGRVVWLKDSTNKKACGTQIIGNAKPVGKDTWDGGWIYDPEKDAKYSVELKPIGADKLRVVGYMGSKLFSETMIWKRAAIDLERCDAAEPDTTATLAPSSKKAAPAPTDEAAPQPRDNPASGVKGKTAGQPGKETSTPAECKKYVAQIGQLLICDSIPHSFLTRSIRRRQSFQPK